MKRARGSAKGGAFWLEYLDRRPIVVAIAGPNGAGKTTFFEAHLKSSGLRFLNADAMAKELEESNSSAHANLAFPYVFTREFDKAIEEAEKGVSLSPNSASVYFALGFALVFAGRSQEAIPILQKCLRLSPVPKHSQVLGLLPSSYTGLRQYEEAVITGKKMLQIYGPDHLTAHLWLASAYIGLGRENEARSEAAEILRIDPKFSVEQYVKNLPASPTAKDRMTTALQKAGLR